MSKQRFLLIKAVDTAILGPMVASDRLFLFKKHYEFSLYLAEHSYRNARQNKGSNEIVFEESPGDEARLCIEVSETGYKIFNDDIASIPLYFYSSDEISICSDSLSVIVDLLISFGITLSISDRAAVQIMNAGYIFTSNISLFNEIDRLGPSSCIEVNRLSRGFVIYKQVINEFTYDKKSKPLALLSNQLTAYIVEKLSAKYRDAKVGVLLSGGADSRLMALLAKNAGIDVDYITFGHSTVNQSDFKVASTVAHALSSKKPSFHYASATNFLRNWESAAAELNWAGDHIWYHAKLDQSFYDELSGFDYVIRGDGDGLFGWKSAVGNMLDALHQIEISPPESLSRVLPEFLQKEYLIGILRNDVNSILNLETDFSNDLQATKNYLYKKLREVGCIAPSINLYSKYTSVLTPLMWQFSRDIATRINKKDRKNKKLLFNILHSESRLINIPFSNGPSWDNSVDFYCSNVFEHLIDFVDAYLPYEIDPNFMWATFVNANFVSKTRWRHYLTNKIKSCASSYAPIRKIVFNYRPEFATSSFIERGLIRMSVIAAANKAITR
jgi:hypothetical protein